MIREKYLTDHDIRDLSLDMSDQNYENVFVFHSILFFENSKLKNSFWKILAKETISQRFQRHNIISKIKNISKIIYDSIFCHFLPIKKFSFLNFIYKIQPCQLFF